MVIVEKWLDSQQWAATFRRFPDRFGPCGHAEWVWRMSKHHRRKDSEVTTSASEPKVREIVGVRAIGVRGKVILRTGLREKVTEQLLTNIFEGRFQPGEQLVVQRVAQMLGVSPTPVREALVELAGLGVVKLVPNHGAVVKRFGRPELKEMSQVRRVLESEAARCSCGHADMEILKQLHEELIQLDSLEVSAARDARALAADTTLHAMVAENCENQRLTAEIERYLLLFRALRNISHLRDSWDNYRHTNDVPEHLRIVGAMMSGDQELAAKMMDEHIRSVERSMAVILFGSEGETAG